jgi:hypothetical protein
MLSGVFAKFHIFLVEIVSCSGSIVLKTFFRDYLLVLKKLLVLKNERNADLVVLNVLGVNRNFQLYDIMFHFARSKA